MYLGTMGRNARPDSPLSQLPNCENLADGVLASAERITQRRFIGFCGRPCSCGTGALAGEN
jgi:hypothetical protein